jgi:hypothetical protein
MMDRYLIQFSLIIPQIFKLIMKGRYPIQLSDWLAKQH